MRFIGKLFLALMSLGFVGLVAGVIAMFAIVQFYSKDLPDVEQLKVYQPAVVTRVHAGDGRLLAEFASERRVFVPASEIPDLVKRAFISAEDQNFYSHSGVDFAAIARAMVSNIKNAASGRRPEGASTITQQVAKNFLLTNEVSLARKIREAILAYRIEEAFDKERILELYLNEIFLGNRSYGVGAAALNYFNKSLNEITPAEAAYLAALPKAPSRYHPVRNRAAALARRDWVIDRMADDNVISEAERVAAHEAPLEAVARDASGLVNAPYFAEEVRRELLGKYGVDSLYKGGLSIRTSINPDYQKVAEKSLRDGMMTFDRRKGWRGAVDHMDRMVNWATTLSDRDLPEGMLDSWLIAVVTDTASGIEIGFSGGKKGKIVDEDVKWQAGSSKPVKRGDIVMVEETSDKKWRLRQIPAVQGAIIVMDVHTGRVLAMQGGWKYDKSEFNRATQARRQPGSAFKPFVYLTALEQGYTPSTLVLDAPFEIMDRPGHYWRPENYTQTYYGPTTMRTGLEKSRNLMTVRLANHVGMDKVAATSVRLGVVDKMTPHLSYSLGAAETTLMRMTLAYATLANGGQKLSPTFVDRIQDRFGETIFKHDMRPCPGCGPKVRWENQDVPAVAEGSEQVVDPRYAYQIVSMMEGVVQRGTATRLKALNRPLAGKTGTTNDSKDAWFMGLTPDLAIGIYVGYDTPKSLGKRETGGGISAPIFGEFVKDALKDVPPTPFRIPQGVRLIPVDATYGTRTTPDNANMLFEAFLPGTDPENRGPVITDGMTGSWRGGTQMGEPQPMQPATTTNADPNSPWAPNTQNQPASPSYPQPSYVQPQQINPAPAPQGGHQTPDSSLSGTGGLY